MQKYLVGGAVRDLLLGRPARDSDYCIVGSTPAEMLRLGYLQVGADFPVFLHPETHDEYALARTERKSGPGYHGFSTVTENVSLEDDLSRRDLTINAMAMDPAFQVTDPFGGRQDLADRVLRHVSAAFSEDPLRVLRVARFQARFGPTWAIAPETWGLMSHMVACGTLDALTQERVWVEIEKGLMEPHPELMVSTLRDLGVLRRPAFAEYSGAANRSLEPLQRAAEAGEPVTVRFALAFSRLWGPAEAKASRIPKNVRDVSHILSLGHGHRLSQFSSLTPAQQVAQLNEMDAFRQRGRTELLLAALVYRTGPERDLQKQVQAVRQALAAVAALNQRAIIEGLTDGVAIRTRIQEARIDAVAAVASATGDEKPPGASRSKPRAAG